jgi:ATP-dependent Zn protease
MMAAMAPELGSGRLADSELIIRGQSQMIELMAGAAAEEVLFPRERNLGAKHDQIEARAFAKVVVAAQPAAKALLQYCYAEARALVRSRLDIVDMLVEALIAVGTLTGEEVDEIISVGVALRSVKMEQARRADERRRQINAAAFLKGI